MTAQCKFKNGTCVYCGDTTQGQCEGWNGSDSNALMAAAKLALEALVAESRTTENNVTWARILTAITALKKAGV